MQASKELGLEQVLVTSTSETYGTAQYVPIDEKHPMVGQSPYSASKIAADQLSISYYRSFNLPVKIVRHYMTNSTTSITFFSCTILAGHRIQTSPWGSTRCLVNNNLQYIVYKKINTI